MKLVKNRFLLILLGLAVLGNSHAADQQSWGSWLRNLGTQAQQQAQRLQSNITDYICLQPQQQWTLSAMGTMAPLALWGTGFISGRSAACVGAASLGTAYLLGKQECPVQETPITQTDNGFIVNAESQKLFAAIQDNLITVQVGIGAQSPPPIVAALLELKRIMPNFIPYIKNNIYGELAQKIITDIDRLPTPPTFDAIKGIAIQLETLVELMKNS